MTIRVLLADDHVMLRQAVSMLIEAQPDLEVVGEADNGCDAIELVSETHPDVVVMDLAMSDLDGISATRRIVNQTPGVRVVILLGAEDEQAVVSAVRAGATGFVAKTSSTEDLLETIRAAAQGHVAFSAGMQARLVQELRAPAEEPERLTGRELEVLERLADGLSNKEIAWRLRISEKTVKSHVSTILGKFGLESRTQAALHATRTGLVSMNRSASGAADSPCEGSVIPIDSRRHRPLARLALT
jgi:DNA-binding NarL/FixJ family response regulator